MSTSYECNGALVTVVHPCKGVANVFSALGWFWIEVDQAQGCASQRLLAFALNFARILCFLLRRWTQDHALSSICIVNAANAELFHRSSHLPERSCSCKVEQIA